MTDAEFRRMIEQDIAALRGKVPPTENLEAMRRLMIARLLRLALNPADTVPAIDRIKQAITIAELES